jgi:hypothetical protein
MKSGLSGFWLLRKGPNEKVFLSQSLVYITPIAEFEDWKPDIIFQIILEW